MLMYTLVYILYMPLPLFSQVALCVVIFSVESTYYFGDILFFGDIQCSHEAPQREWCIQCTMYMCIIASVYYSVYSVQCTYIVPIQYSRAGGV